MRPHIHLLVFLLHVALRLLVISTHFSFMFSHSVSLLLFLKPLFSFHLTFFIPSLWFSTFPLSCSPNLPSIQALNPHLLLFSLSFLFFTSYPCCVLYLVSLPHLSMSPPPSPSVSCPTWLQVNSRITAAQNVSCSLHSFSLREQQTHLWIRWNYSTYLQFSFSYCSNVPEICWNEADSCKKTSLIDTNEWKELNQVGRAQPAASWVWFLLFLKSL